MAKTIVAVAFLLIACMLIFNVSAFTNQDGKPCPCATTFELRLVCGSDGVTYDNPSALKCEKQCKRSNIELNHEGPC